MACKFTPLGFETSDFFKSLLSKLMCKFTPLGFETKKKLELLQQNLKV